MTGQPHATSLEWACDECGREYPWTEELPEVGEEEYRIDVTAFGDPNQQFLIQKQVTLTCEECSS